MFLPNSPSRFRWLAIGGATVLLVAACRPPKPQTPSVSVLETSVRVDRTDIPEMDIPFWAGDPPTLDGRLDDAVWQAASVTEAFVSSGDGRWDPTSPVNGHALLAWNPNALHVAFVVYDANPTSPYRADEVDPHVWAAASGVEWMIQPGDHGDNRTYFEIQVDVNGAVWDTRFDDYNRPIEGDEDARRFGHQEWESGIERAVYVDAAQGRYVIEATIPWDRLATERAAVPPMDGDVWRLNLYTFRDGQRHARAWSPILGEGNFHRSSRFGRVTFRGPAAP
jgi:hypothetical protein